MKPRRPLQPYGHTRHGKVVKVARARIDEIAALWSEGKTFPEIVEQMQLDVSPSSLRAAVALNADLVARVNACAELRATALHEQGIAWGYQAAAIGDAAGLRTAIDTVFKAAAKTAPHLYGDRSRVELSGPDGGAVQVKADLTLTPAEAYARLANGK